MGRFLDILTQRKYDLASEINAVESLLRRKNSGSSIARIFSENFLQWPLRNNYINVETFLTQTGLAEIIENSEKVFTYASMSYEKIQQAEKELKVSFSEEYKEYLAEYGVAIFNGHELTGLCDGKRLDVVRITCKEREISDFKRL